MDGRGVSFVEVRGGRGFFVLSPTAPRQKNDSKEGGEQKRGLEHAPTVTFVEAESKETGRSFYGGSERRGLSGRPPRIRANRQLLPRPGWRILRYPKKGAYWFRLLVRDLGRMPRKPGWPR